MPTMRESIGDLMLAADRQQATAEEMHYLARRNRIEVVRRIKAGEETTGSRDRDLAIVLGAGKMLPGACEWIANANAQLAQNVGQVFLIVSTTYWNNLDTSVGQPVRTPKTSFKIGILSGPSLILPTDLSATLSLKVPCERWADFLVEIPEPHEGSCSVDVTELNTALENPNNFELFVGQEAVRQRLAQESFICNGQAQQYLQATAYVGWSDRFMPRLVQKWFEDDWVVLAKIRWNSVTKFGSSTEEKATAEAEIREQAIAFGVDEETLADIFGLRNVV